MSVENEVDFKTHKGHHMFERDGSESMGTCALSFLWVKNALRSTRSLGNVKLAKASVARAPPNEWPVK